MIPLSLIGLTDTFAAAAAVDDDDGSDTVMLYDADSCSYPRRDERRRQ